MSSVEDIRRCFADDPLPFRPDDLRLPLRVHQLRKRFAPSSPERRTLDEAVNLLFAADIHHASQMLDGLERATSPPSSRAK
jgi:hypothetical protein